MKFRVAFLLLASLHFQAASALMDGPDTVFGSSFEGIEACVAFDGLGDSLSIPYVTISGDFSLNGDAFPALEYDDATINFRDRHTGNVFEVGNTHDQSYSVRIIPGNYDVIYKVETPGDDVPLNSSAVLMEDVALLANGTLDIPVTAYRLSGVLSLNNSPFPNVEYDDGTFHLSSDTLGDVLLAETQIGSFIGKNVLPGEYELRFSVETLGDDVPGNQWGLVDIVNINGNNAAFSINLESIELRGSMLHNGALMPGNEFDDGNFYLETASGDRVWLDNSHEGTYTRNVMTGSNYDIYWEVETSGATVPVNQRTRIAQNVDISTGKRTIDMDSYTVSGDIMMNGAAFPGPGQGNGRIVFRDTATGDENQIQLTANGASYDRHVLRANYDIAYQYVSGQDVPRNRNAVLDNITVKSNLVRDINIPADQFSASIYHNEALFPISQLPTASIVLEDTQSDDSVLAGNASSQSVSSLVVHGTYDVFYRYTSGADIPSNRNHRMLKDLVVSSPPKAQAAASNLLLNIYTVPISGQFYLVDVNTPADALDSGLIRLRNGNDNIILGASHSQSYNLRIAEKSWPIRYDVYYESQNLGNVMPANGDTYVGCVLLEPIQF